MHRPTDPQPNTAERILGPRTPLTFDRRPDRGALAARVGARLELERAERERLARGPAARLDALERRCERLEAAIATLALVVDDVDDRARLAVDAAA